MTVPVQTPEIALTGNGVTTAFAFNFKVFDAADLIVRVDGVLKTLTVDYTVSGFNLDAGGNVTFGVAPAAAAAVTIQRSVLVNRLVDYQYQGDFLSPTVNRELDRAIMMIQDIKVGVATSLRFPVGDPASGFLPNAAMRALRGLAFDAAGNISLTAGSDASSLAAALAAFASEMVGAGLIGYSASAAYASNTVGKAAKDANALASSAAGTAAAAGSAAAAAQSTVDTFKLDVADLANVAKGTALMGYKLNATGAVGRTLASKLLEQVSVKDFGALGNGTADDAAAINAAITHVSGAGGGTVLIPRGTYIVGASVILLDNVTLQGVGLGASIIKQKASTALNATVYSLNAYSLWGTASLSGPAALNIRDLTIDANRQNGASGDGLAIYGPLFSIDNVEVCNASLIGVRTEFGTPGAIGHGFCAQSNMNNCWVHDCNSAGVKWCGPADPSITNCNIYRNLVYNLWLAGPRGTGCKVLNCHVWGSTFDSRQATTGIRVDTVGNLICNTVAEGSTVHQIHLRAGVNYIVGGNLYYNSDATNTYGVVIGDTGAPSNNNTIMTRIDNCRAGAIYFFNTVGLNKIDVQGYNDGAGPSTGYTGAVPTPYTDWINMQVFAGHVVTNGQAIFMPQFGPITAGAINSGGAGFRQVISPN